MDVQVRRQQTSCTVWTVKAEQATSVSITNISFINYYRLTWFLKLRSYNWLLFACQWCFVLVNIIHNSLINYYYYYYFSPGTEWAGCAINGTGILFSHICVTRFNVNLSKRNWNSDVAASDCDVTANSPANIAACNDYATWTFSSDRSAWEGRLFSLLCIWYLLLHLLLKFTSINWKNCAKDRIVKRLQEVVGAVVREALIAFKYTNSIFFY